MPMTFGPMFVARLCLRYLSNPTYITTYIYVMLYAAIRAILHQQFFFWLLWVAGGSPVVGYKPTKHEARSTKASLRIGISAKLVFFFFRLPLAIIAMYIHRWQVAGGIYTSPILYLH